jgi:hypothetical protein
LIVERRSIINEESLNEEQDSGDFGMKEPPKPSEKPHAPFND